MCVFYRCFPKYTHNAPRCLVIPYNSNPVKITLSYYCARVVCGNAYTLQTVILKLGVAILSKDGRKDGLGGVEGSGGRSPPGGGFATELGSPRRALGEMTFIIILTFWFTDLQSPRSPPAMHSVKRFYNKFNILIYRATEPGVPPEFPPPCIRRTNFITIWNFFVSPSAGRGDSSSAEYKQIRLSLHKSA